MSTEDRGPRYRYFAVGADVFARLADGAITRGEAFLAVACATLSRLRGEGCYASNAYLARACRVSVRQVRRELSKLLRLGLLRRSAAPPRGRTLMATCPDMSGHQVGHECPPNKNISNRVSKSGGAGPPAPPDIVLPFTPKRKRGSLRAPTLQEVEALFAEQARCREGRS